MSESAGKALDILFYLARVEDEVSLARLSKETGMNKATALRYLAVLESRGVVEKRPSAGPSGFHCSSWAARCLYGPWWLRKFVP
jgi:DNA-binding IclR family transcriptional regulator